MERLRDVLEQSGRATDKVTSIVKHTDARLLELQELMGPVQERAQSLSNAHKNLTAVRDETRTWLDHLEAINEAEARVELAFEDEDPDEPTGPEAFLRCVDRVAQAERFFGERRSFEGAEVGWRRAGEILRGCLRACEREFQKLVAAQNRERRESSRRASVPDGKSQTATTEKRHSRRGAPAPPPPFGTEAWDAFARVAREGEDKESGMDRGFDASYHDSRSAEFEARPPRRLAALARVLLTAPGDPNQSEDRETHTTRLYVDARVAALDETEASTEASALDASASAADASERAHATFERPEHRHVPDVVSLVLGDGAVYIAEAAARAAALDAMTRRWSAEPRVARAAFAAETFGDPEDDEEDDDRRSPPADLARIAAPAVVAASAARALAWVDTAAARTDPARAFGLLAARAHLKRLRWAMETSAERDAFGRDVFAAWDGATASAARGAKRALEEVEEVIARAAETLAARAAKTYRVGFAGPADATRLAADAAALVRSVVSFLARVSECDDARAVLFGGAGSEIARTATSEDEDAAFAAFARASLEAATKVAVVDAKLLGVSTQAQPASKKASGKPPAALAAALLAAAADEAVFASGASEAARRAFGEAWPARARARRPRRASTRTSPRRGAGRSRRWTPWARLPAPASRRSRGRR